MQVLIAISGFCGFCSRIGNTPCTTPFDFLFVISIHIPAWGTTTGEALAVCCIVISIHVPAWGTTVSAVLFGKDKDISIHVPAWGTTENAIPDSLPSSSFQSTFPRRERRFIATILPFFYNFNPRSRVGNDSDQVLLLIPKTYFNPRSRVGNDGLEDL